MKTKVTGNLPLLQTELARVTDWIRNSDQKSAFLSVYYTAAAGFCVSQRSALIGGLDSAQGLKEYVLISLIVGVAAVFVLGVFFLLSSVFPRLKNNLTDKSLFYFGSIARRKYADYMKEMESLTEEETANQLLEQIYTNSKITDVKMKSVRRSTFCLCFLLIGLFLLWI